MFYVAAGYEVNELPVQIKAPQYRAYFESIGWVLPCKFCRDSYVDFLNELDFDEYVDMDCGMIRLVYDLKNKVNEKLEAQEQLALQDEYENASQVWSPDDPDFWRHMQKSSHRICYTKPSPPFEHVVRELSKARASCSTAMKTCRDPLRKSSVSTHKF